MGVVEGKGVLVEAFAGETFGVPAREAGFAGKETTVSRGRGTSKAKADSARGVEGTFGVAADCTGVEDFDGALCTGVVATSGSAKADTRVAGLSWVAACAAVEDTGVAVLGVTAVWAARVPGTKLTAEAIGENSIDGVSKAAAGVSEGMEGIPT